MKSINTKSIKNTALFSIPIIAIIGVQMLQNYYLFGGFFTNPNWEAFAYKIPIGGILASFLRLDKGIMIFSPILIFSFLGLKEFFKEYEIKSSFVYLLIMIPLLFYSSTLISWTGLDSYSFRYYVPITSFFYIPMTFWYRKNKQNKTLMILFFIAITASIIINLQSAVFHTLIWNGPPWRIITLFLENIDKILY